MGTRDILKDFELFGKAWGSLAVVVTLAGAILLFSLPRCRRALLPPQRVRAVPWKGNEVWLVFFGMFFWPGLILTISQEWLPGDQIGRGILAQAIGYPPQLVFSLLLMHFLSGTQLYQIGIHASRWRQGVLLGAVTWLWAGPLLYSLHIVINWVADWWRTLRHLPQVPPHQLVQMVESGSFAWKWPVMIATGLVLGPIVEEFVFRGVVQRWAGRRAGYSLLLFALAMVLVLLPQHWDNHLQFALFFLVLLPGYHFCPLWAERAFSGSRCKPLSSERLCESGLDHAGSRQRIMISGMRQTDVTPWPTDAESIGNVRIAPNYMTWLRNQLLGVFDRNRQDPRVNQPRAIYATAVLFACVHSWPDAIPLFFLGLLLGWVAYRTQSLVAPITLHVLFNAVGCIELVLTQP